VSPNTRVSATSAGSHVLAGYSVRVYVSQVGELPAGRLYTSVLVGEPRLHRPQGQHNLAVADYAGPLPAKDQTEDELWRREDRTYINRRNQELGSRAGPGPGPGPVQCRAMQRAATAAN